MYVPAPGASLDAGRSGLSGGTSGWQHGHSEIKTTNYNAKDKWWHNGEEIVPVYYEAQGRHYMAVMGIDRVYLLSVWQQRGGSHSSGTLTVM